MNELQELVQKQLEEPNYLIKNDGDEYCVIYFSSNGLYGFDELDLFKKNIIGKNKFEFYGVRVKNSKNIYLRDVTNNWYVNGINKDIDSLEKLLDFLKRESAGKKIITLGSSAGGYAAVLFGNLLGAERIFTFSGQFVLPEEKKDREYFSLVETVNNSNIPTYYIFPTRVDFDVVQYNHIKGAKCLLALPITSSIHGVPVYKEILKKIINSDEKKLNKMFTGVEYKEKKFIIKFFGLAAFLSRVINKNLDCRKK